MVSDSHANGAGFDALFYAMQRQLCIQGHHVHQLAPLAITEPAAAATDAHAGVIADGSHA